MLVPIMDQQQIQREHQLPQWSIVSQPPVTYQQQFPSHVYTTSSPSAPSSMKRGRVYREESSASYQPYSCETTSQPLVYSPPSLSSSSPSPSASVPVSATPKKARSNNYNAPRSIKPSVLTAMGTLVSANDDKQGTKGSFFTKSVPMRRRLSGGQIDQYIGEHDISMDADPNRPRSMSF